MKKLLSLVLTMVLAFSLSTPVHAADESTTLVNLNENQVTYDYTTPTPVTNGRVAVTFNEDELTLVSVENFDLFDVEDVNQGVDAVEGMKTIYFAFASAEAYEGEDIALKLVFEVAEGMEGKTTTITTVVEEMNNEEEKVEIEDTDDVVEIPAKEEPEEPENPEDPEDPKDPEKPGDSVDTGDDSQIFMYLGLLVAALVAIVALVFNRKKTCK